jgi:hypothetical protein
VLQIDPGAGKTKIRWAILSFLALLLAVASEPFCSADTIPLGDAANYAVLYEGNGGSLQITNVTTNGNVGVGGTGAVQFSGPGTISGKLDFSAGNTGQYSSTNPGNQGPSSVNYNVSAVSSALSTVNSLNSSLNVAGTSEHINLSGSGQSLTVNESAGTLRTINGITYSVFTVSSFIFNNGTTLTINGNGSDDPVVFDFSSSAQFGGTIDLTGGLTADQVLFNITGSNTLQINANGATEYGDFLDPNGTIQVSHSVVDGRILGGHSSMQIASGDTVTAPTAMPESGAFTELSMVLLVLGAALAVRRRQHYSQ